MGKQINFYMDKDTESAFSRLVLEEGGQILYEDDHGQPTFVTTLPEPFSGKGWLQLYLYRPVFGELRLRKLPSGATYVDTSRSPVIEFGRTVVRLDDREVSRGRLWVEMKYWDDEGNPIEKPAELAEWYEALRRWVIRNLPLKYGDSSLRVYASASMQELAQQGYEFL